MLTVEKKQKAGSALGIITLVEHLNKKQQKEARQTHIDKIIIIFVFVSFTSRRNLIYLYTSEHLSLAKIEQVI